MRLYRPPRTPMLNGNVVVRKFFQLAQEQRISQADIAERAGLNKDTIKDWRTRTVPRIDMVNAALNVLGYELSVRRIPDV